MMENLGFECALENYKNRLTDRVFKILPMQESGLETLDLYINSLSREIIGLSRFSSESTFIEVAGVLKGLDLNNHKSLRGDIFSVIKLIKDIKGEDFIGLNLI